MKRLTHETLLARQQQEMNKPKLRFVAVLDNIRSFQNVGSIFRTADGIGMEKLWLCGITGYPPNAGLAKTALGAEERVDWDYSHDAGDVVQRLKTEGYTVVALEQCEDSPSYDAIDVTAPLCLVVGHEVDGVSDDVLAHCDAAVEIPMQGLKNSLNVAVAFGIAGYHFRRNLLTESK